MIIWPWSRKGSQEVIVQRVEVPVIGDAHVVLLYAVDALTGRTVSRGFVNPYQNGLAAGAFASLEVPETEVRRYLTCEQAHAEHPGRTVTQQRAIKIGTTYFLISLASEVSVQPKPKVAKGAKR